MAVKPAGTKKAVAKRPSRSKTTSAPVASRVQDRAPDSAPIEASAPIDPHTEAAASILRGGRTHGTGRERTISLQKAGLDPKKVSKEVARLRGESLKNKS